MKITEYLKNNILYLDGGMGTLLQKKGLNPGELPEKWNVSHPEVIKELHKAYFDAGCNVVNTNTFGLNSLKFSHTEIELLVSSAIKNARDAIRESEGEQEKWVALDVGPSGKMLAPYGELDFECAVKLFSEVIALGEKYGADLVFIETMSDCYETKAALLAAKESCSLPVFVSNAYGKDGKLLTGASPSSMVAMLEGMGADAIGVNCSLGPKALEEVIKEYAKYSSLPIIFKPNAGLPRTEDGKTVYDLTPEDFTKEASEVLKLGVRAIGGCCGTTPEYIKRLIEEISDITPEPITKKNYSCVSSYTDTVFFENKPVLIGERINPTGKKRFKEALRSGDMDYILNEAVAQEERGAHILDVNVGLPEIDEEKMLVKAVSEIQAIISLPLQIDTSSFEAMEAALRRYNGKPMINSVSGKRESMEKVFPLAKKYGGLVVALTLDEDGIPDKAEDRLAIAEKILKEANKYGIDKRDLIFDPLALTVSADNNAAKETLKAVKLITEKLHAKTSLGVSNVSFGLPKRDIVNSTFFTLAMENGLSAAIMNPYSSDMIGAYRAFLALNGLDENCKNYIAFTEDEHFALIETVPQASPKKEAQQGEVSELKKAIIKGLCNEAKEITKEIIKTEAPLSVVNNEIIPALNVVGEGFEKNTVYLPQLLMSAEAAKSAFLVIKENMTEESGESKCKVVLATVKGDIHDIGKNIVKLLLENYGFKVIDLGRDVAPEEIAETVAKEDCQILGLSALMTTTVPSMEKTIKLVREVSPKTKVLVGGAVLNEDYARSIGADGYAKDAMEGVRLAEKIYSEL